MKPGRAENYIQTFQSSDIITYTLKIPQQFITFTMKCLISIFEISYQPSFFLLKDFIYLSIYLERKEDIKWVGGEAKREIFKQTPH